MQHVGITWSCSLPQADLLRFSVPGGQIKLLFFLLLEFTPCKDEQPLQGIQLQEKEAQKD